MEINFPFYQNQWFGINFKFLKIKKYLFNKASEDFYTDFYKVFYKKYKNLKALPENYINEKTQIADFLYQQYYDKNILSYGSGLGVIEKQLAESLVDITCYESAKNANFFVKDFLNYVEIIPRIKYDVIYFSYVLYSMNKLELKSLVCSLNDNLNIKGEIVLFFSERKNVNLVSILRLFKILLFGRGEFQFWGYERNTEFYVSIFKNCGYKLKRQLFINDHKCLVFIKQ